MRYADNKMEKGIVKSHRGMVFMENLWGRAVIDKRLITKEAVDDRMFGAFVEHLGSVVYGGIYNPKHQTANAYGFREDAIELVRALHPSVIRYPGGNFVCSFFWEDSVGPVEQRPSRLNLAWQQQEPNIVGLAEFETWVKAVGAELMLAVNLSTRGAVDAANLVEYCNYPKGSYYSDLRIAHGHPEPYDVRLWCVGNEVDGPWNIGKKEADQYGRDAVEAVKAMNRVSDGLEYVAVGSSGTQLPTYLSWDREVLEQVYEDCQYLSLHRYMGNVEIDDPSTYQQNDAGDYLELYQRFERNICDVIAACDYVRGIRRSDKTMYLSVDEYNVIDVPRPEYEDGLAHERWQLGSDLKTVGMSLEGTLLFGLSMITLLKHSDRIKIACQSLLINNGGMVICEDGADAWVNGTYYVFLHCSLYGRGKVLTQESTASCYDTATCRSVSACESVCIYHEDTRELTVFVVNKSEASLNFTVDTANFENLELIEHLVLTSQNLMDANSEQTPDVLKPVKREDVTFEEKSFICALDKFSWNVIRIREVKEK